MSSILSIPLPRLHLASPMPQFPRISRQLTILPANMARVPGDTETPEFLQVCAANLFIRLERSKKPFVFAPSKILDFAEVRRSTMPPYDGMPKKIGSSRGSYGLTALSQDSFNSFMTTVLVHHWGPMAPFLARGLLRARSFLEYISRVRGPGSGPRAGLLWTEIVLLKGGAFFLLNVCYRRDTETAL
jgi:hypothetical protein